ncbi:zinc-ribbon domain-containing protein [Haloprofundus salinisoli]|uniref:zinc-ribbon domain-containing protein n=1 Tax=Haloprofundus salinisoli TaxID=2876193 RepID=UPI001CCC912B|nr:zinc-ribbon domain-containing protein [Haloprofundus salinisoli]
MVPESKTPNFCADCGARLTSGASFCSQCGTAVSSSTESGPNATLSSFRQRVREYTVHGWEIEQDYGDRVVVKKRGVGSIPVHVLLFVFTYGLGNAVYAWYRYSPGASRAELRADGTERWVDGRSKSRSNWGVDLATAGGVVVGCLLVFMSIAVFSTGISGVGGLVLGTSLLAAGLLLFPPIRDRLNRAQSLTTFGRKQQIDTEPADETQRCVVCGERARGGVTRTFAEKTYLAGVPVKTHQEGSNSYCRRCAAEEAVDASTADRAPSKLRETA